MTVEFLHFECCKHCNLPQIKWVYLIVESCIACLDLCRTAEATKFRSGNIFAPMVPTQKLRVDFIFMGSNASNKDFSYDRDRIGYWYDLKCMIRCK